MQLEEVGIWLVITLNINFSTETMRMDINRLVVSGNKLILWYQLKIHNS